MKMFKKSIVFILWWGAGMLASAIILTLLPPIFNLEEYLSLNYRGTYLVARIIMYTIFTVVAIGFVLVGNRIYRSLKERPTVVLWGLASLFLFHAYLAPPSLFFSTTIMFSIVALIFFILGYKNFKMIENDMHSMDKLKENSEDKNREIKNTLIKIFVFVLWGLAGVLLAGAIHSLATQSESLERNEIIIRTCSAVMLWFVGELLYAKLHKPVAEIFFGLAIFISIVAVLFLFEANGITVFVTLLCLSLVFSILGSIEHRKASHHEIEADD